MYVSATDGARSGGGLSRKGTSGIDLDDAADLDPVDDWEEQGRESIAGVTFDVMVIFICCHGAFAKVMVKVMVRFCKKHATAVD